MGERWRRMARAFSGDRGPDPQAVVGVAAVIGVDHPHVLAWGTGRHGDTRVTVVAVDEGLAIVDDDGTADAVAWHEVVRGGWRAKTSSLYWAFLDGSQDSVTLERPGDLPAVFNDRVTASIVVREPLDVEGGRVTVAGRRRLGSLGDGTIQWTAVADGDADLTDPVTESRVLETTERLRQEWR